MKQPQGIKTVVLYDLTWHGHHPTYLRLLTRVLLDMNVRVWLFCQNSETIRKWLDRYTPYDRTLLKTTTVKKQDIPLPFSLVLSSIFNWVFASKHIRTLERKENITPDLVIFLRMEDFNKGILPGRLIDLIFPYRWAGLFIHVTFNAFSQIPFFPRFVFQPFSIFSSKQCQSVMTFQEDHIKHLESFLKKPCFHFPDFTDESPPKKSALSELILKRSKGRKIVSLLGCQDKRKGTNTLIRIAKRAFMNDVFFVFAGKGDYTENDSLNERFMRLIGNPDKMDNCFFHFKSIPDEAEFNTLFAISDIIYAVYHDFSYSSNIMTKAALFEKPILVSSGSLMEKRAREYNIGRACDEHSTDDILDSLIKLKNEPLISPNFKGYCKQHSKANVYNVLSRMIAMLDG